MEMFETKAEYDASVRNRLHRKRFGVTSTSRSANWHYRNENDYFYMMEYARDIDRNDCLAGQAVSRVAANVIQDGIMPNPNTGDTVLDEDIQSRWMGWATTKNECSWNGEMTFRDMEKLALRHVIVDGDVCFLPFQNGTLRPMEAHRLRTPRNTARNVMHGILFSGDGIPLEYWFTKEDLDIRHRIERVGQTEPIKARDDENNKNVYHVYNPNRFTQIRGVTAFAPIMSKLTMHDDIQFAKLVQQQSVSAFAILRQKLKAGAASGRRARAASAQKGSRDDSLTFEDGSAKKIDNLPVGIELTAGEGEEIKGFSPNVPNPEFFEHVGLIIDIIAANLSIPAMVLLLDATKSNFSAWRGAMDQARIGMRDIQQWLIDKFHEEVYMWKIRQWLATDPTLGRASQQDGVDIFRHTWNRPTWDYIEPNKDVTADAMKIEKVLTSPRRLQASRSRNWHEVAKESVEDRAFLFEQARDKARELNATSVDDEEKITWRDLVPVGMFMPAMMGVADTDEDEDQDQEQDQEREADN